MVAGEAASTQRNGSLTELKPIQPFCLRSPMTREVNLPVLVLHADKDQAFLPSMFKVGQCWVVWSGCLPVKAGVDAPRINSPLPPTCSCQCRATTVSVRMCRQSAYETAATGHNKTGRMHGGCCLALAGQRQMRGTATS